MNFYFENSIDGIERAEETVKSEEEYNTMSSVSEMSRSTIGRSAAEPLLWKLWFDIALACVLMFLTGPVILAAWVLVRLTSRGPGFYNQIRLGLGGRHFRIYKLRSMYDDCERDTGPRWATHRDSRVTPIGRVLRATHIDELPQLWNILRGEMSLVGPRPERPEIVPQLERALPCYRERLEVRPGVTGLAQVQLAPDSDLGSVRRKLACDLYYIRRVSPWLDLRIILATALNLLGIPSTVTRQILRIPGGDVVERAYRKRSDETAPSGEMDTLPQGIESLTRVNTA
jgi:lipopolysaccharide/colanic/teichoic acid biosynthesis glycosyltransferase